MPPPHGGGIFCAWGGAAGSQPVRPACRLPCPTPGWLRRQRVPARRQAVSCARCRRTRRPLPDSERRNADAPPRSRCGTTTPDGTSVRHAQHVLQNRVDRQRFLSVSGAADVFPGRCRQRFAWSRETDAFSYRRRVPKTVADRPDSAARRDLRAPGWRTARMRGRRAAFLPFPRQPTACTGKTHLSLRYPTACAGANAARMRACYHATPPRSAYTPTGRLRQRTPATNAPMKKGPAIAGRSFRCGDNPLGIA